MKNKNKQHLDFYKKCAQTGFMPVMGLCGAASHNLINGQLLDLFRPTKEDRLQLIAGRMPCGYWGRESFYIEHGTFTPRRQTIVLLMAAINNEL